MAIGARARVRVRVCVVAGRPAFLSGVVGGAVAREAGSLPSVAKLRKQDWRRLSRMRARASERASKTAKLQRFKTAVGNKQTKNDRLSHLCDIFDPANCEHLATRRYNFVGKRTEKNEQIEDCALENRLVQKANKKTTNLENARLIAATLGDRIAVVRIDAAWIRA